MDLPDVAPVVCDRRVLHKPEAVLAAALEAYIALDTADRVVGWNAAAEALFGYSHAEACGRDVAELIIPERYVEQHRAGLARVAAGGPGRVLGQRLQLTAMHRDGHELAIELSLTVTDTPAGPVFHAFAHDVSARVRAGRFAAVEAAVSRGLAEASSSDAAAARVVEALGVKMSWPVTELWLVDVDHQLLVCAARYVEAGRRLRGFAIDELDYGMGPLRTPGSWRHARNSSTRYTNLLRSRSWRAIPTGTCPCSIGPRASGTGWPPMQPPMPRSNPIS